MSEYLIKLTLAISVAYILYVLFMQKSIDFRWLRIYFISMIIASLALPALKYIPVIHQKELASIPAGYFPDFLHLNEIPDKATSVHSFSLSQIVQYVYVTGFLITVLQSLIGFIQLGLLVLKHGISRRNGLRVVLIPNLPGPFSFFHTVFINPEHFIDDDKGALLRHEKVHVKQWHSLDLILLEVVTAIQWFNPLAWQMKRTVKELHEFMADKGAIGEQYTPLEYQRLLLSEVCGLKFHMPVNGFNSSLTKKRILMITNNKRNKRWFAAFALLMVAIIATDSLSRINIAQEPPKKEKAKVEKSAKKVVLSDTTSQNQGNEGITPPPPSPPSPPPPPVEPFVTNGKGDNIYVVVEENATFQGGDLESFRTWIIQNLKYPDKAAKNKIEGKVIASFVITKEGKTDRIKILRGLDPELDMETLRVIKSSPDWQPAKYKGKTVNQQFTIPVQFKLTK